MIFFLGGVCVQCINALDMLRFRHEFESQRVQCITALDTSRVFFFWSVTFIPLTQRKVFFFWVKNDVIFG